MRNTLTESYEKGREEERNHWINQTANEHDKKIREEMKKEVLEKINKTITEEACYMEHHISVSGIIKSIKQL